MTHVTNDAALLDSTKFSQTPRLFSLTITQWIFIFFGVGLFLGVFAPEFSMQLKPFRGLFLNGIKCIIAPLIFSSIVVGVSNAGSPKNLGSIGLKAVIWFELATTVALIVGLAFVNIFRPGDGLSVGVPTGVNDAVQRASQSHVGFGSFIEHLLPTSFSEAAVKGDVLQMVVFSTLFGLGLLFVGERGRPVKQFCEGLSEVMFKMTGLVMWLAPIGVGSAIAMGVAEHGWTVVYPLLRLVGTLYGALIVFVLLALVPALKWSGVKIGKFFQEIRPSVMLAFATTASESAYPMTLESLEKMGVKRSISSFVLPLGYSFNLDGSTLYLGIASIFVAQAAHIELSLGSQLALMLSLMLTTKGIAAVPRASLVVLSGTLLAFQLPLEAIGLILAVDELMDMARTAVNLLGNATATLVVSKWSGEKLSADFSDRDCQESDN